jgi:anaerobic selenocysteine-containing dehydrogenase
VDIVASLAHLVLGERTTIRWQELKRHCNVREMIARIVPGFEPLREIDRTKQEFQINGRTFHQPRFATPSGKARFRVHPLPQLQGEVNQLRLMTVRSEGQFNTVVYEEEDIYRGQDRRDVILMNRADIERLGLKVDQQVRVRSAVGEMHTILVREFDIRAGNVLMYFPEANVLVPATTDPLSKTPAFKAVLVTLQPEQELTQTSDNVHGRVSLDVVGS